MEFSSNEQSHNPIQPQWDTDEWRLVCHTLRTPVERWDRLELFFCCPVIEAIKILALYQEGKSLVLPRYAVHPHRIFAANLYICQVTLWQVVIGPFYQDMPERPWELLKKLWSWRRILWKRLQAELAVRETVFEIFHVSGQDGSAGHPLAPEKAEEMGLMQFRFHDLSNGRCYLQVLLGENERFDKENRKQIIAFLDDYMRRLRTAFGQPPAVSQGIFLAPDDLSPPEVLLSEPPKPAHAAAAAKATRPESAPLDLTVEQAEMDDTAVLGPHSPTATMGLSGDLAVARVNRSMMPPIRPRLYKKSLLKICRMAARRQAAIVQGKPIPDLSLLCQKHGPSKNTLEKAGVLLAKWHEPSFSWNVVTWLHEYSSHSADEITDYLNYLRTRLNREEWELVSNTA